MKKILLKSLLLIILLCPFSKIKAQCTFDIVGTTSVSAASRLSDMAVAPNNKVYTIAYDTTSGNIQLKSAFTASASWTLDATITTTTSVKPVIKIRNDGKIYVFISDGLAGNVGKVYSSTGGVFTQVGAAVSAGAVSDLSIAFNSAGVEYIAFTDGANSNRSTVMRFFGGTWVNVGTTGLASTSGGYYNSLILDNTDTPVVAFRDFFNGYKISVMKLSGSNWVPVTGTGTVSANQGTNSVLKVASNGNYYLGYTETTDVAIVQTYNGSVWAPLGSPVAGLLSTNNSFNFDLDLDPTDVPYFIAIPNTSYYPTAYKYVTGAWTTVATGTLNNSNNNTNPTIDIDNTGSPYYSYVDISTPNNVLFVKTLASPITISSQPLATLTICNGSAGSFSVGVAGGAPTYQWQSSTGGVFANAGAPYVNASTNILSFTANPSINQNKLRCVVNVGCKNLISNTSTLTVSSPMVTLTTTNPTCFAACNGMINSIPSGGIAPYTYSWTPSGSTVQNLTGACAGTYSVTVTDASGCQASQSANLVSPSAISSSVSGNLTICNGSSTTLTLTATGGTPGYTYSWSPGGQTSAVVVVTPTITTTYTANVTDANACIRSTTVTVTLNALPPVSAGVDNTICSGGSTTNSATGANTYTWNPGNFVGAIQSVTPLSTTTYTVVGTNTITGCTNSDLKIVNVTPNPTITAVSSPTAICAGSSANLTVSGATSYTWMPGALTGGSIIVSPSSTTVYTVTGMAGTGCSNTKTLSLTVNANPTVAAFSSPTAICVGSSATLTASGAISYTWNPGAITNNSLVVSPSSTTVYTVTGSNGSCTNMASILLTVNPNPIATASNSGPLTCTTVTVALNSGSVAGATYLWSGPSFTSTLQNATANMPGSYTVLVTNSGTGCSSTAITSVSQNTASPTLTIYPTNTLTCNNTTVTVSISTTVSPVMYSWSGPGIVSGGSTANANVNQPGSYSVTVTNTINGCSSMANLSVTQDITVPTLTVTASSSTICSGNSTTLTASGTANYYEWNSGALYGAIQNVSPTATTIYSVLAMDTINGCANTKTISITVNANPVLAITGNTNICKGSTTNLTASGAVSYLWDSGATTNSISVTPTVTTTYTVTGTSVMGCSSTITTMVSIISSKSINGAITSTAGATGGNVILYKYTAALSQWDSVGVSPFTGSYSFSNIDSALYVVRAIPTATNIQVTYGTSSISWQNATIITHGCASNTNQNISLIGLTSFILGPGVLSGIITEANGFGQRMGNGFKTLAPGAPIGGIVVKGGRNPGGQMMVQTVTDAAGQYTLSGLPLNAGDETFILVDIPGLDTNGTYHLQITATNTQFADLDFTVDSIYINPIGSVTAVSQEISVLDSKILMFPNPARQYVSIQYELIQSADVKIDLFDVIGNKVKTITEDNRQEKNKYNHSVNLENLSSGIYFVKLKINSSETIFKLIITE